MRSQDQPHAQGFTLIEVMVATAVTSVIVLAGMAALTMTGKAVRANEQISDAQQNARMAMEMITHDIKMAGMGPAIDPSRNPPPVGNCGIGGTPVPMLPGDNNPTVGVPDTGPDQISLVVPLTFYGAPAVPGVPPAWQTTAPLGIGAAGFANVPINAAILPAMVTAGLAANSFISIGGVVAAQVGGAAAPLALVAPIPGPTQIPTGTQIFLLQCITYQVIPQLAGGAPGADLNNVCGGNAPCLVRGIANATVNSFGRTLPNCNVAASPCLPIVNGIEDLQFAYACDGCLLPAPGGSEPNGRLDDVSLNLNFDQADYISNQIWNNPPMTPSAIKMVQVTIVARQQSQDNGLGDGNSQAGAGTLSTTFLTVDDHIHANGVFVAGDAGAQVPPYASVRRRVVTRTVETRNARPWS
ncbi:MAG: prepilin-type N-terminal cleavage/methylation domain-containing protein [Nitrospirota bacterium]|nr:prepilin-type N-terminal cleavage/methylation domain-containing protein [Nitrospirota bacterium]MDP2381852.1 prepilin-type N-terminal cleavage/methylation domain-containing protein [Nitrospirota bacterium]MDP3597896.1 prepilin-type N-terminal cleavage/methylation domain-containing protein [Nitrospirota bacterium]